MKKAVGQSMRAVRGFTLIEMMVVVAIVAIIAALAFPSFNDMIAKNRVKAAAEEIYGLVLLAKSETSLRDTALSVSLNPASTPWCVGVDEVAGCDCTNTTSCTLQVAGVDVVQVVNGTDYTGVSIAEDFAGSGPTFALPRLNVSTETVERRIEVVNGDWQLDIVVSPQGLIRVCNPNDNAMPGYGEC